MANGYARYSGIGGGGGSGGGVTSLNTLTGDLTLVGGTGITITPSGGNTLTIAATNSGTVTGVTATSPLFSSGGSTPNLTIQVANTSQNGYLSSTDWNTFNNKQAAGNYITALTGDATATGPGSAALTLATVNSNIGTFASVTTNGKGLVTSASALSGDATTSGSVLTLATVNSNVGSFTNANITVNAKGLITAAANGSSGTGTVTSVALATPGVLYTVSGSPVTTSGTLTLNLVNQSANTVFAGPTSGGTAAPSFRALTNADLPSGTSAFAAYASNIINTNSSNINSTSFVTFSNSPAFTFTPTVTGTYKVYCSPNIGTGAVYNGQVRIFNSSGGATLLEQSTGNSYTGNESTISCQSVYTLTASTTYVFDLQGCTPGSASGSIMCDGLDANFYMFAEGIGLATASFTSMGAFGSSPNGNAGTISGNVLTLQPASGSFPGGVSTTTQTFAGSKTIGFNVSDAITIGAASSTALQQINGGIQFTTRTVTASTFTVDTTTTDKIIYTDSTSNAITITLPAPTNGRTLLIADKTGKAATNNITILPHASETINGLSSFVIAANYNNCDLTSDGTNWIATKLPTSGNSFLTAGTTYTTPVNITPQTRFKFTLIGGGGGAGGINTAADGAAGGGAGAAVIVQATGLSANTAYTVAIGGGGTAGASTPTAGGNGGITTINFLGSTYTAGGGTGANDTATSNGGAGGTATSTAGTGVSNIINMPGGGGGAASGVTTNGSGQGGSGFMGWGGISVIAAGAGSPGTGFGGGGSGGKGAAAAGGAGAGGCIVVEWWN